MKPPATRRQWLQRLAAGAGMGLPAWLAGPAQAAPAWDAQAIGQLVPWPRNQPWPALAALGLDGRSHSLADYAGAPLILNFWASYCAPCIVEMPQFNRLLAQYRPQGLRVVAVNHGEMPARVLQFLQGVSFQGEVLLDRSQNQLPAWGGVALPSSFVFDAAGQLHWWHVGAIDWLGDNVQAKLRSTWRGG